MAARTTQTPVEADGQRAEIARLYLKGMRQAEIAAKMGCTQQNISYHLAEVRKAFHAEAHLNFSEAQARELAKIDALEVEAWEAWERSKRDREIHTEETTETAATGRTRNQRKTQGRDGSAPFLQTVQWCIDRRCKLLGLDAPEKVSAHLTREQPEGTIDERMAKYAALFGGKAIPIGPPAQGG